jgi:ABC-type sugar transport system permease subunit
MSTVTAPDTDRTIGVRSPATRRPRRRRISMKWPYLLPAAIVLLALSIYPLAQLIRMSVSEVTLQG